MRKRILLVALVLSFSLGLIYFMSYQKPKEILEAKFISTTWSKFQEHKKLQMLLQGFGIESMIDIPCADLQTLKQYKFPLKQYIGVVASKEEAYGLQAQFGSCIRSFIHRNITTDPLPKVDLILCWEALCRLPSNEIQAALLQFKKSGAKFLLMKHFPDLKENLLDTTQEFKPINWQISPYNFPEPLINILQLGEYGMESLALWSLDKL